MSITISSTTDTQEQVNAAAGIEAVEEPKTPPAENTPRPQEDPDQDPDDDDDENGEEEEQPEKPEQPPVPKKKGGWLRKIEALERDRGYMARYIEQMEQALAQQRAGAPGQQQQNGHQPQQAPDGRPSQDQFETYEAYVEALTDYKVNQRLMTEREQYAAWMQQQAEQQAVQGFQSRASEYTKVAPDYYEVMQAVEHIPVSPALKVALVESEIGHQVAYELAKNPAELARITRLAPVHVAREVGRIEARIEARSAPEPQQRIMPSKAPAPIRPVGQGANGGSSLKLDDNAPYQDWKRQREKQIAAAKRR